MTPNPLSPRPPPSASARLTSAGFALGVATAVMTALAAGAIWCLLALWSGQRLLWLALPVGLLVAQVLRKSRLGGRWWSALLAIAMTLLACAYAGYLMAAAQVASLLGLALRDALPRIGVDFAGALLRAQLDLLGGTLLVAGMLLAAWRASTRAP